MKNVLISLLFLTVVLLPVAASAWPAAMPASSAVKKPGDYTPQVPVANEPGSPGGNGSADVSGAGDAVPFTPPSGYKPFKAAQSAAGETDGGNPSGQAVSSVEPTSSQRAPQQEPPKAVTQNAAVQPEAQVVPGQVAGSPPQKAEASGDESAAVPAGGVKAESQPDKEGGKKSPVKPHVLVRFARFFRKLFG